MVFDDPLSLTLVLLGAPLVAFNLLGWWADRSKAGLRVAQHLGMAAMGTAISTVPRSAGPQPPVLSERRLRAGPALKATALGLNLALGWAIVHFDAPGLRTPTSDSLPVVELGLLAIALWHMLAIWSWELRFDAVGLSAPVMIFGRRARMWRHLVAVTQDSPLALYFHFADGAVISVPKHVAGHRQLLHMAEHWLHQDPPHARTARG